MDKFKVGDKVRIINCVEPYSEEFNDYIGKTAIITKVNNFSTYDIDIDKGENNWYNSELELAEQSTTYTITDILNNFPTETKFLSNDHLFRIQLGELQTYDEDTQEWRKSINSLKQILDMKFTKVEEPKLKPMTFEEAVRTGNKIKYEYDNFAVDYFCTLQNIFGLLMSPMYSSKTVLNIILKGTWFAEGVYE